MAKQAEREQEAADKKEAKLAKLRRIAKGENKHEFHDPKYAKEREESTSRYVFINSLECIFDYEKLRETHFGG